MFIRLTDEFSVAPQISPADVAAAKAEGFAAIVNNRPDGEAPGQPAGAEIAAAAAEAGLRYAHIPVGPAGMSEALVAAMAAELAAGGRVLAFCRSGTRSTHLWALADAAGGGDPEEIVSAAAEGGYDIEMMRPMLNRLAGKA